MIRGERVLLRPVEEADYSLIQAWQNHPEVWWWMDYEAPFSLRDIAETEARAREEGHPFIIEVGGRPIGRIGLNQFRRRDRICSLYVFIGEPDAWSSGLGPDAINALVSHAFDRMDLHMIELWSLGENERAIRAYERCGFRRDAVLRERSYKDGRWVDRVVMSVTRDEFARIRLQRNGSKA
ncbi:MAG TPA: GNAT family protein [Actinomycetota bacterium]